MKKNLLLFIFVLFTKLTFGLDLTSYDDRNYNEAVQTVILHPTASNEAKPIVNLNEIYSSFYLQFDVLGTEAPYLYYTFIHCTHDWKPSSLQQIEYIDGFTSNEISEYIFSRSTSHDYVHYDLIFPTEDMTPKLSGNYLLVVYADNDLTPKNIYFTRRFMILDNLATINASVPRYPYDLTLGTNLHPLKITATYSELFNGRASDYSNLTIQQNGRTDNMVVGLKPSYVYPDSMTYENSPQTIFHPGNQYRHFNISNIFNRPENTRSVIKTRDGYVVTLMSDAKFNHSFYVDEQDIFGEKYIYIEQNDRDIRNEAEYVDVKFFLQWPKPLVDQEMHLLGALNDWRIDSVSMMEYNANRGGYEKTLRLKQGFYNYSFLVTDLDGKNGDLAVVNGDFWETLTEYTIYLYYFDFNLGYDMLIGVTSIKSH